MVLSLDKVVQKKMRWVCTNIFENTSQISSPINNRRMNNSKFHTAAVLQQGYARYGVEIAYIYMLHCKFTMAESKTEQ